MASEHSRSRRTDVPTERPRRDEFPTERLRRDEFSWTDAGESIYLNAASTGPLPERCVRAQDAFTRKRAAPHRLSQEEQFGVLSDSRTRIAALIGADVAEIALTTNTSAGLNLAAWAFPLGPGDVVVIPDLEFPANVYPWMAAAAARGFALERVPARDGLLDEEALLAALDRPGVRVLAVSWVGFATGVVADLDALAQACLARGIRFVVDAIQGLGALTLDVSRTPIDLLACGGQKWLLSPWGTGFTYVRHALVRELAPQPVSWMGVQGSDDFSRLLAYDMTWRDDARRFEQITLPFQDFAGMAASLELIHELGPAALAGHIAERTGELLAGAAALGVQLVTPHTRHAGIASLRPADAAAASARLNAARVTHSEREGTVRLAPHCYTTSDEIRVALHALVGASS
ncbi:MAG TPA: aminotransferase class V-fold PLP-dependent enzyme [Gemmatimonadaceae bacterium]|nr:aminotransferase class V-fold PLP-dependent enzyme [Gemmatimonadaceae bacterium]